MEGRSRFPEDGDGESDALSRLRISLMADASRSGEMHHRGQSAQVPVAAEVIDLYWDGESKERSLDRAANVALPYFR